MNVSQHNSRPDETMVASPCKGHPVPVTIAHSATCPSQRTSGSTTPFQLLRHSVRRWRQVSSSKPLCPVVWTVQVKKVGKPLVEFLTWAPAMTLTNWKKVLIKSRRRTRVNQVQIEHPTTVKLILVTPIWYSTRKERPLKHRNQVQPKAKIKRK